jgi:predicted bacteriocin transport accessory protein
MAEEKKKTNTNTSKNKNSSSKKNIPNKKPTQTKKTEQVAKKDNKKINEKVVKENKVIKEELEVKEEKVLEEKKTTEEIPFVKKHLTDILLIGGALILIIIGIISFSKENNSENYLIELTYDQYVDMMESGERFAFIVESATCSHCQNFMPIVKKFVNKNEVYVYYIDLTTLSEDDYALLLESNSFFIDNADDWGTPTTIILEGSTAINSLVGETTEDEFETFLIDNEIME